MEFLNITTKITVNTINRIRKKVYGFINLKQINHFSRRVEKYVNIIIFEIYFFITFKIVESAYYILS